MFFFSQANLAVERGNVARNETLAHEYGLQIEELRQRLCDDRFARAVEKETDAYDKYLSL